jgi:predicted nucleic acid-binding protein
MPILIDRNLILDIVTDDPIWGEWSDAQLTKYQCDGLFINPIIYAELCAGAENIEEVDLVLVELKLEFHELEREALFLAAKAFTQYRRRGGTKTSPLPDFFIGAQAQAMGTALLTRDQARYRTYFPKVTLITPDPENDQKPRAS